MQEIVGIAQVLTHPLKWSIMRRFNSMSGHPYCKKEKEELEGYQSCERNKNVEQVKEEMRHIL